MTRAPSLPSSIPRPARRSRCCAAPRPTSSSWQWNPRARRSRPGLASSRSSAAASCAAPPTSCAPGTPSSRGWRRSTPARRSRRRWLPTPLSAADALEFLGGAVAAFHGDYVDLGGPFAYTRREPLGVCVGIGAWNYPIQVAGWKSAPALAMGNAMVFKPSENTPLSALALAEIYTEAGLPDGLFNVVQGFGDVGAALVSHPVRRQGLADRLGADRQTCSVACRLAHEACHHGTRRQVAADRLRRRRHRECGRRRHARQFLFDRPGLLERHARLRAKRHPRPLRRAADRAHEENPHRRSARSGNADGPADQQGAAREGAGLYRDRQGGRRPSPARRRRAVAAGLRGRLLRRADHLHRA